MKHYTSSLSCSLTIAPTNVCVKARCGAVNPWKEMFIKQSEYTFTHTCIKLQLMGQLVVVVMRPSGQLSPQGVAGF